MRLEFKSKTVIERTGRKEGSIAPDNIAKFNQREHRLFLGQRTGNLHRSIGTMAGEQDRLSAYGGAVFA